MNWGKGMGWAFSYFGPPIWQSNLGQSSVLLRSGKLGEEGAGRHAPSITWVCCVPSFQLEWRWHWACQTPSRQPLVFFQHVWWFGLDRMDVSVAPKLRAADKPPSTDPSLHCGSLRHQERWSQLPTLGFFLPEKKKIYPLSLAFILGSRVESEMLPSMERLTSELGVRRGDEAGRHTKLKDFIAGRELGGHQSNLSLKERILSPKEVKWLAQGQRTKRDKIQI